MPLVGPKGCYLSAALEKEQMNHSRPCFAYLVACMANSSGVNVPAFHVAFVQFRILLPTSLADRPGQNSRTLATTMSPASMYWELVMRPSEKALGPSFSPFSKLVPSVERDIPAVTRVGKTLNGVADHAHEVALVPVLVRCAERLHVFRTRVSASFLKWRKVGRAMCGTRPVRGGLFQAALPGAILSVVELSTLKVRITGSAPRRCRTISWMAGYCSRWYRSASSLVSQKLNAKI